MHLIVTIYSYQLTKTNSQSAYLFKNKQLTLQINFLRSFPDDKQIPYLIPVYVFLYAKTN